MMATLRVDHPDIEEFIDAKRDGRALTNFNLSVQITDEFMAAVRAGRDFALAFPSADIDGHATDSVERRWTGTAGPVPCRVLRRVPAAALWERLLRSAHASGEPGVLFVDRINAANHLWYREQLTATNPCGELPLPPEP